MSDRENPAPQGTRSAARIVPAMCILLGGLLITYAISDHPFYGDGPGFGTVQAIILGIGVSLCLLALAPAAIAARLLAVAVSGFVALLIGEIAAETLLSSRTRSTFISDPELIFSLAPGRTTESRLTPANGGRRIVQHVNSDGFRGPELLPAGSETRIVVYGDSFIHAFYSPLEETFPCQLEGILEDQLNSSFEVINAGVSSYGPDQILQRMRTELPVLRPDVVVVAIFAGNDYGDLLRNKMFKLDDSGELQRNSWVLSDELVVNFELNERESTLRRALRDRLRRARRRAPAGDTDDPLGAMLAFCLSAARAEYDDYVVRGSSTVTNARQDHFSADVSLEPNSLSARYRLGLMDAVLRGIQAVADEADVPLVFLFIPHPLDACGEFLGGVVDEAEFPDYSPDNLTNPLKATATSMGTPFLDLMDSFRGEHPTRLYLRGGDDHWNSQGQSLAARRMAELLIERQLLPR